MSHKDRELPGVSYLARFSQAGVGQMIPFGVDPSLTSSGFCVDGKLLAHHSKSKGVVRLIEIRDLFLDLQKETLADVLVIEGYAFAARNSHAHSLGELGGVLRVAAHEAGMQIVDIPPTVRAKFATGKGNAGKAEVVSSISARTGMTFEGKGADDMCDAWVMREMAWAARGRSKFDWPKQNLQALEKIDWSILPF